MSELKPCPFCGGEARTRQGVRNPEIWFIDCNHGCMDFCRIGKEEAIKAWNTRHKEKRTCENCRTEYEPTNENQRWCSKKCKHEAHFKRSGPEIQATLAAIYKIDAEGKACR